MPRRKKNLLEGVDVNAPSKVQKAISAQLDSLPPGLYALLAHTPDQKQKYNQDRAFFRRVGAIIDSYFNGTAPPDFSAMPKYEREESWNEAFQYLAFYGLVWANWDTVQGVLVNICKPELPEMQILGMSVQISGTDFEKLTTPLAVSLEAMRYRALSRMSGAFGQSINLTAYAMRKTLAEKKRLDRTDVPQSLKEEFERHEATLFESIPWAALENTCVKAAINVKGPKVKEYLMACREKERHLAKKLHKQTGYRVGIWENGKFYQN